MGIKLAPKLAAKLLEGPNEWPAGSKGATLRDGVVEVHSNEISHLDEGGVPSRAINTAV